MLFLSLLFVAPVVPADRAADTSLEPSWGELQPAAAPAEPPPASPPAEAIRRPPDPPAAPKPAPAPPAPVVDEPPPERPIRWRIGLKLEFGATRLGDPRWFAASDRRAPATGGASLNFDVRPGGGRIYLGPTLGLRSWGDSDRVHEVLTVSLRSYEILAGLRLSIAALDGLDAFVQLRGGPVVVRRHVHGDSFVTERDRAVTGGVDGLAGLSFYLPKRWLPRRGAARITGGLEGALGWAYRGPVEVRSRPLAADDAIPTSSADFGTIPLRGLVWHVGFFVRFM